MMYVMSRSANSIIAPAFLSQHLDWVSALNQVGMGVLVFSRVGDLSYISPRSRNVLGEKFSQDLIDHGYKGLLQHLFDNAVEAGSMNTLRTSTTFDDMDGSSFREYIETPHSDLVCVSVLPLGDHERIALIHDQSDVNSQHLENRSLFEQRNMLLQAVEYGHTGLMVFDAEHEKQSVLFVNESCCRFLGYGRSDLLGRFWKNFLPEIKYETSYRVIQRQDGGQKRILGCQLTMHQSLGIIFMADITELHEKEEQVRQINKLDTLGQLAGGIAHDFNNILAIIRGYSHIMERKFHDNDSIATPLASILRACERGAGLSQKLLAFGRRKSDEQFATNVQDTISQLQSMIKPILPSDIELAVMLPDAPMRISCTSDHLTQIMMNLVVNARDAMPDGGLITIDGSVVAGHDIKGWPRSFEVDRDYIKLAVIDHGIGMAPDVREHIFEPFFTTKPVDKGTGLGLSVVYGLIQQHNGSIRVHSEEGRGTTFEMIFQIAESEMIDDVFTTVGEQGSLASCTVMVVDDESELREALSVFLIDLGMNVIQAVDGNDALLKQDEYEGQIDFLISDVRMPELNGADLAFLWKDIRPETRLILMSGDLGKIDLKGFPANKLLKKPINFSDLSNFLIANLRLPAGETS
jgi:signal transduction histidine kinase